MNNGLIPIFLKDILTGTNEEIKVVDMPNFEIGLRGLDIIVSKNIYEKIIDRKYVTNNNRLTFIPVGDKIEIVFGTPIEEIKLYNNKLNDIFSGEVNLYYDDERNKIVVKYNKELAKYEKFLFDIFTGISNNITVKELADMELIPY